MVFIYNVCICHCLHSMLQFRYIKSVQYFFKLALNQDLEYYLLTLSLNSNKTSAEIFSTSDFNLLPKLLLEKLNAGLNLVANFVANSMGRG